MNFAEKLVKIASQMQPTYEEAKKSYEKGYADGFNEGLDGSAFWDIYQDNGNRRNYDYAFAGSGWTDELFDPKYPIVAESNIRMFSHNDKITHINCLIDLSNQTHDEIDECFNNCSALKTIQSLKVGRKTMFYASFDKCYLLEHIGFLGELWYDTYIQESDDLSDETVIQMVCIAKDFVNDEDETIQELAFSTSLYFSSDVSNKLWELTADERFPEQYQGMYLGEVLELKGWGY